MYDDCLQRNGGFMISGRDVLPMMWILLSCLFVTTSWADDEERVKVVTDWTDAEQPLRVDCHNLPIIADGIGGAKLSCSDRLSLYADFNCFPMKKDVVEEMCPEWQGLEAGIDWERVAELIDAQADEEKNKMRALEQEIRELDDGSD
jgi:hypothetical protein